ncbi:MAG: ABC transporter substrate-binding protein [Christensenellales bacterium]
MMLPTATPQENLVPAKSQGSEAAGELRLAMPQEESGVDPYAISSYKMQNLLSLVYEPPIMLDSAGRPQPYLFETWEINSDGSATFTIRKNLRFHSGQVLDCSHIAENLRKIRVEGEGSAYAFVMNEVESWLLSEDNMQITIFPMRGVYPMLMSLTFPVTDSSGAVDDLKISGTGPYIVSSFQEGEGMRLLRNESWWRLLPQIKAISVHALKDDEAQIESLLSGSIDMVYTRATGLASYRNSKTVDSVSVRSNTFEFISINLSSPLFSGNQLFKSAVIHAVDKKDLIANVYQGVAVPADFPVPADAWFYSGVHEAPDYSEEKSREMLEQMGYADRDGDGYLDESAWSREPLALRLITNSHVSSSVHRDAVRRLEKQLKAVGIKAEAQVLEMDSFQEALEAGEFDLAYVGVDVGSVPHIDAFFAEGGSLNFSGYSSALMEALLLERAKAATQQEFIAISAKIEERAMQDMPIIGICFRNSIILKSKNLSGLGAVRSENVFINIDEWVLEQEDGQ